MKKIKVLHILNELRLSGMEMMLLNSASEWHLHGIEIEIVATGEKIGEAARNLQAAGYKIHHISFVNNRIQAFFLFRNFLKDNKYDIIHINTESNFLLHVINVRSTGYKKIVRTIHSIFNPRPLGRLKRLVDRFIVSFFKVKYISVGKSVAENEKKLFYTNSKIIYNWYDSKRFNLEIRKRRAYLRKKYGFASETFVITTIGNCSPVKRHELLIYALSKLPKSVSWVYLHVGKEQKNFAERKLAKQLKIENNCKFLGSRADVENILAMSDVYIMTSKFEGLGIAALEAMASGIPTILTNVPGLIDILELVKGAIGVDSTPNSIVSEILNIYKIDLDNRKILGENLYKQVVSLFSVARGVKNYSALYNSL